MVGIYKKHEFRMTHAHKEQKAQAGYFVVCLQGEGGGVDTGNDL